MASTPLPVADAVMPCLKSADRRTILSASDLHGRRVVGTCMEEGHLIKKRLQTKLNNQRNVIKRVINYVAYVLYYFVQLY